MAKSDKVITVDDEDNFIDAITREHMAALLLAFKENPQLKAVEVGFTKDRLFDLLDAFHDFLEAGAYHRTGEKILYITSEYLVESPRELVITVQYVTRYQVYRVRASDLRWPLAYRWVMERNEDGLLLGITEEQAIGLMAGTVLKLLSGS